MAKKLKIQIPERLQTINAKRIRNDKIRGKSILSPISHRKESKKDIEEFSSTLDVWSLGFLDIETTHLAANFGHVLCICVKRAGGEILTLRIDNYPGYRKNLCNDLPMLVDLNEMLAGFDVIVGWNSHEFDMPFIDTRLTVHGKERAPLVHSIDLLPIARKKLRLHSNRLEAVATAFDVENEKTKLDPMQWQRASHGSKEDLDKIVYHCKQDVVVLEEVFVKMRPYVNAIFRRH